MAKETPTESAPLPNVALSHDQFQQLLSVVAQAKAEGKGGSETDATIEALRGMAKAQEMYAEEFKRQVRRSNQFHPNLSVYTFDPRCEFCKGQKKHPDVLDEETGAVLEHRGLAHPKDALKHDVFFCFQRVRADELTPIELELYNSFESDKEARNGTWRAMFKRNGSRRELHIFVPFQSIDEKSSLPDLVVILSELLYGQSVVDPVMALEHVRSMQKQIDELNARLAAAVPA